MKWLRFYSEVLNDPKVQHLPPGLFKHWVNLLCVANEGNPRGHIPDDPEALAFQLRVAVGRAPVVIKALADRGLLDLGDGGWSPHNWKARQLDTEGLSESGNVGNHRRWHLARGTRDPECRLCVATRYKGESPLISQNGIAPNREAEAEQKQRRGDTETEAEAESSPAAAAILAKLVKAHERDIGTLNATACEVLQDWAERIPESAEWAVDYAFKEATLANSRNLKYVTSILKRLESEGWIVQVQVTNSDPEGERLERRYREGRAEVLANDIDSLAEQREKAHREKAAQA